MYDRGSEPSRVSDMSLNVHASSLHPTVKLQPVRSSLRLFVSIAPKDVGYLGVSSGACHVCVC